MFQSLKVWAFRLYYRLSNRWAWRNQSSDIHWGALEIPSPAGPIHGRLYNAGGGSDKPLIVYFHGGGWVIGDLQTHHAFCLELSAKTGCTVIAVDYRLAPEYPFPAAPDDCLAAVQWIAGHLGDFGPCNGQLVLAGDSAGGNLALCTALQLEEGVRNLVTGTILLYPATDHYSAGFSSYVERAKGQLLTTATVQWFWDTYLGTADRDSPAVQCAYPLRASNLDALPRTLLVTAEFDPLRDEGAALADKLRDAGVEVRFRHFDQAAHGFACSEGLSDDHRAMMVDIVDWLG